MSLRLYSSYFFVAVIICKDKMKHVEFWYTRHDFLKLGTIIWSITVSQSRSRLTRFPISLSVYLCCLTGLHHMGLRKARNVSCLLSPPLCCLFGGKPIHAPSVHAPLYARQQSNVLKGRHANNSCQHIHVHPYCLYSMFPSKINLYDGSGKRLSEFQPVSDNVWLLSVLSLSWRNM